LAAAVSGVRDALAERGMLGSACVGDSVLTVDVDDVRFDVVGIVVGAEMGVERPMARGTGVSVTVSVRRPGGEAVSATEYASVASQGDAVLQESAVGIGVAGASRRAGELVVRRMVGEPVPVLLFGN